LGGNFEGTIYSYAGPKFITAPISNYGKLTSWIEIFKTANEAVVTGCERVVHCFQNPKRNSMSVTFMRDLTVPIVQRLGLKCEILGLEIKFAKLNTDYDMQKIREL
jgi:hypothetical protein